MAGGVFPAGHGIGIGQLAQGAEAAQFAVVNKILLHPQATAEFARGHATARGEAAAVGRDVGLDAAFVGLADLAADVAGQAAAFGGRQLADEGVEVFDVAVEFG